MPLEAVARGCVPVMTRRCGVAEWLVHGLHCIKADRTPEQARMPLRKRPIRPVWRPLYAAHAVRIDSWSKFLSEAYWNVELDE